MTLIQLFFGQKKGRTRVSWLKFERSTNQVWHKLQEYCKCGTSASNNIKHNPTRSSPFQKVLICRNHWDRRFRGHRSDLKLNSWQLRSGVKLGYYGIYWNLWIPTKTDQCQETCPKSLSPRAHPRAPRGAPGPKCLIQILPRHTTGFTGVHGESSLEPKSTGARRFARWV